MSQTPASGATAYATPQDWQNRADIRSLCQWASDTDTPMTPSGFLGSNVATALLAEASGWVEAACLVGGRYVVNNNTTPPINDLLSIQQSGSNASAMLAGLVTRIANYLMWLRRPARFSKAQMPSETDTALALLQKLEDGVAVFGTVEGQAAAVVNDVIMTPQQWQQLNLAVTIARPYFGRRGRDMFSSHG